MEDTAGAGRCATMERVVQRATTVVEQVSTGVATGTMIAIVVSFLPVFLSPSSGRFQMIRIVQFRMIQIIFAINFGAEIIWKGGENDRVQTQLS